MNSNRTWGPAILAETKSWSISVVSVPSCHQHEKVPLHDFEKELQTSWIPQLGIFDSAGERRPLMPIYNFLSVLANICKTNSNAMNSISNLPVASSTHHGVRQNGSRKFASINLPIPCLETCPHSFNLVMLVSFCQERHGHWGHAYSPCRATWSVKTYRNLQCRNAICEKGHRLHDSKYVGSFTALLCCTWHVMQVCTSGLGFAIFRLHRCSLNLAAHIQPAQWSFISLLDFKWLGSDSNAS